MPLKPRRTAMEITAAGIDDLALFDLGGVLQRGRAEAWLDAFVATEPAERIPEPSLRLRGLLAGAALAGVVLGALGQVRRRVARRG